MAGRARLARPEFALYLCCTIFRPILCALCTLDFFLKICYYNINKGEEKTNPQVKKKIKKLLTFSAKYDIINSEIKGDAFNSQKGDIMVKIYNPIDQQVHYIRVSHALAYCKKHHGYIMGVI